MKHEPQLLSRETPAETEAREMLEDLDRRIDEWSRASAAAIAASLGVQAHGGLDRDELRDDIAYDMRERTYKARRAMIQIMEGEDDTPR